MKCDRCGFTANIYTEDLLTGKMICIECLNKPQTVGELKVISKYKKHGQIQTT